MFNDSIAHSKEDETKKKYENKMTGHLCPRCCSLLSLGNNSVKISPRKPASKKTLKLIRRCNKFKCWNKLSSKARKAILRYERSTNALVINCSSCGRSKTACVKRKTTECCKALPSTPVVSVRSLFHTPKSSGPKDRTPHGQSLSTPSSSAKKRSAKRHKHSKLQLMLDQNTQEKQHAQQSPLLGFLQSL
ncbi:UPF0711 protein C18orf21-like isoform X2 [Anneissia japonica]|nr:UPF0711 protein C18orf21-like isoform X2 [Anneissia japonica]